MAVLTILEVPDPRLRAVAEPVESVDDEVRDLIADMFETMYDAPGIGLAAIQVGVERAARHRPAGAEEDEDGKPIRKPRVFINPGILRSVARNFNVYNEGCLSIPEQYAEVERPARCRVKWLDDEGRRMKRCRRPARDLHPARDRPPERRAVHRPYLEAEARHAA